MTPSHDERKLTDGEAADTEPRFSRRKILLTSGAVGIAGGLGVSPRIAGAQRDGLEDLCEAVQTDVCLVIDVSNSMGNIDAGPNGFKQRLEAARDGLKTLVDELDASDQGSLVSFESEAEREFDLTGMDNTGKTDLKSEIDLLFHDGLTNTQGGITFGAEELLGADTFDEDTIGADITTPSSNARDGAKKFMVLFSDGKANMYYNEDGDVQDPDETVGENEAEAAATAAKDGGIRILTVAVGEADKAAMEELASSSEDAFTDENLEDLTSVFADIAEAICPEEIEIDIKPCSNPNAINLNANGVIPVGIKHTDEFDPNDPDSGVDVDSLRFGPPDVVKAGDGAESVHNGHVDDVVPCEGDGEDDLVVHFHTKDAGFEPDDEEGWLVGESRDGELIAGRDSVKSVGGEGSNS